MPLIFISLLRATSKSCYYRNVNMACQYNFLCLSLNLNRIYTQHIHYATNEFYIHIEIYLYVPMYKYTKQNINLTETYIIILDKQSLNYIQYFWLHKGSLESYGRSNWEHLMILKHQSCFRETSFRGMNNMIVGQPWTCTAQAFCAACEHSWRVTWTAVLGPQKSCLSCTALVNDWIWQRSQGKPKLLTCRTTALTQGLHTDLDEPFLGLCNCPRFFHPNPPSLLFNFPKY